MNKRLCASLSILVSIGLSSVAYADTFTGPSSITISEDGVAHFFYYTLTNTSASTITNIALSGTALHQSPVGDESEFSSMLYGEFGVATCGSSLGAGLSCTMELEVFPGNGAGETDNDSLTFSNTLTASFTAIDNQVLREVVTVTINDPSAVPETSSVLLLGGAIGCVGLIYRRRFFAR
jgi:hypothetical protein